MNLSANLVVELCVLRLKVDSLTLNPFLVFFGRGHLGVKLSQPHALQYCPAGLSDRRYLMLFMLLFDEALDAQKLLLSLAESLERLIVLHAHSDVLIILFEREASSSARQRHMIATRLRRHDWRPLITH